MFYDVFLLVCIAYIIYGFIQDPSRIKALKNTTTVKILIVNLVVFVLTLGGRLFSGLFGNSFYYTIGHLQVYRLLTSMFFHLGIMHILCNSISLINIGLTVENMLGKRKMLIAYFSTGIIGGFISILIHQLIGNPVISVGASGAICGLIGVVVSSFVGDRVSKMKAMFIAILPLIIIGFAGSGVDNICHFVCFFVGILVGKILMKTR